MATGGEDKGMANRILLSGNEAIAELDHAVGELGLKAAMFSGVISVYWTSLAVAVRLPSVRSMTRVGSVTAPRSWWPWTRPWMTQAVFRSTKTARSSALWVGAKTPTTRIFIG